MLNIDVEKNGIGAAIIFVQNNKEKTFFDWLIDIKCHEIINNFVVLFEIFLIFINNTGVSVKPL